MKIALLFILPLLATALPAQQPLRFAPAFRHYSTDRGLPDNWVYGIYQDKTGYIWVSTNHGVCRFNGYDFEQFPDTMYANLTAVMTGAMTEDERGRLWYVDFQSRVFYIENNRIHPYAYNDAIAAAKAPINFFHGLIVEGNGKDLWLVGHSNGVLHVWGKGQCEHILPPETWNKIQVFERHGKWQQSIFMRKWNINNLEIAFQGDKGTKIVQHDSFRIDPMKPSAYFCEKLSNQRWCFYFMEMLFLVDRGKLVWWRPCKKQFASILEEPDGALLAGNIEHGGLDRYRSLDDLRTGKVESSYLSGFSVSRVFRDREGGYWIGTQGEGLFYCPAWGSALTVQMSLSGDQNIHSLATDGRRRLFAGLQDGHVFELALDRNRVKDISPQERGYLNKLFYDLPSQTLAFAGQHSDFYRQGEWKNATFKRSEPNRKGPMSSNYLSPSADHRDWYSGSSLYLCKLSVEKQTYLDIFKSVAMPRRFYAVRQMNDGRVWTSCSEGLFEWKGDTVLLRPAVQHPAFLQPFLDIGALSDGSLVLCPKGHGVVIWKPGTDDVTEIGERDGLLSAKVGALHVDAAGVIWACTHRGLSKLTPLGGRRYRIDNFTVKHGLPSNTINDVTTTAGGDVWVATAKGLFCLREKPNQALIPAPLFTRIQVNNVDYANLNSLPHDSANLVIDYLALHFRSGGDIPYRFRLLAPDNDTAWTLTRQRSVNFSNLAPASYRFEVQAQDEEQRWSPVSALAFSIRPPWYATWWVRGLGFALLGLAGYALYRYRTGQIKKESRLQAEMLRLEHSALQAQMNPHFIFNCLNSIQHFILNNEPDAAVLFLAKFAKLVRGTLNASVAGEVSLDEEVRMLDHYLALERLRFKHVFEYKIAVDETLDRSNTLLPPLIVQPFVENAVLHGMKELQKDGQIAVTFGQANGYLCVDVRDNGPGLRQQAAAGGRISLGSSITRRRLELLQQKHAAKAISVEYLVPEDGVGTRVSIRLPL